MTRHPEEAQSAGVSPAATVRKALRWLAALGGAALMACAAQAGAQARETLGPGDTIRVTIFQNPDLTAETRVSERGAILYPLIGEVAVSGLTPAGAAARIAAELRQGKFLKDPQVTVSLLQVRSRQVSVLGHVGRPGRYALDDPSLKLTDILALAGGISPSGDHTVTLVSERDGKVTKREVDVPGMYRSGDLSPDVEVRNGDTIFVPRAPVFYVYGEVQRAGAYRLEPDMTVMHALSVGGGLTPRGTTRGIKIHRKKSDGALHKLDVQLADAVQADDVIHVPESWF